MSPPTTHDDERTALLRRAAGLRTESRLLRESARESRDLSILLCARNRALLERYASLGKAVESVG